MYATASFAQKPAGIAMGKKSSPASLDSRLIASGFGTEGGLIAKSSVELRNCLIRILDSAAYQGLTKEKYHYAALLLVRETTDTVEARRYRHLLIDAIAAYSKDIYQGAGISRWIRNDEVSPKYQSLDDDFLFVGLNEVRNAAELAAFLKSLEPQEKEYKVLKDALKVQIQDREKSREAQLVCAVNLYRWVHHFNFAKVIVVNIPAANLHYYVADSLTIEMKVVAGKPSTKSPRFSTWCYRVVLYPYWNVPRDIALKELLPRFKRSPSSIDKLNIQVIAKNGKIVDHHHLNWSQYSRSNFPYSFRQCTGCDNSLGVIKFDLTDPFSVYLHDTNFKLAFLKDTRFLSHGCIRIEKPVELGNAITDNKIDSNFLRACLKGQDPFPITLQENVPVFVLYNTAAVVADTVAYYRDIYHLF